MSCERSDVPFVVIAENMRLADFAFESMLDRYWDDVKHFRRRGRMLVMRDGTQIHVITRAQFKDWAFGRVYRIPGDDNVYSGKDMHVVRKEKRG